MGTGYFRFFACVTIILLLSACSPANLVQFTTPPPLNVTLSGTLYKPEGQGPFPAIVALHGYGGILDYQDEWVQSLKESGFVTLMVDSYCGRGYYCPGQNRSRILPLMENPMIVSPEMRAADASAALGYLQAQPFVDPDRIGVLGWSGGATAALIATKDSKVFKAAVGFYPTIPEGQDQQSIPALILAGEHDPNAGQYVRYMNLVRKNNLPVKVILYPSAYRKFDEPGSAVNSLGMRQEYNREGALDAKKQVEAFFSEHLRSRR